jgi:hypothetical protein
MPSFLHSLGYQVGPSIRVVVSDWLGFCDLDWGVCFLALEVCFLL